MPGPAGQARAAAIPFADPPAPSTCGVSACGHSTESTREASADGLHASPEPETSAAVVPLSDMRA